jgi:Tfp pilus assembly protein PilO
MTRQRRWVVIAAVAVVVILAGGWFLLVKSEKSKVTDLNAQRDAQLATNQSLLTQITALQAQQKQLPQQQLILEKFSTLVPETAAEPTLIRQLTAAAKSAGIDLTTITPGSPAQMGASAQASQTLGAAPTASAGTLYGLPLALNVSGSYANIESFLNALERLPRALVVSKFSLTPTTTEGGATELTTSLDASVFFAPGSSAVGLIPTAAPSPTSVPNPADTTSPAPATSGAPVTTGAPVAPATATPAGTISRPQFRPVTGVAG